MALQSDCFSGHGSEKNPLPELRLTTVIYLPPHTKSRLEPIYADRISSIKRRYTVKQYKMALYMNDERVEPVHVKAPY